MSRYIGQYVKTCDLCCRTKVQHRRPTGELHLSETPNEPWDTISVDFIVELPHSNGYDAVMNVIDGVTKRACIVLPRRRTDSRLTEASRAENKPVGNRLGYGF